MKYSIYLLLLIFLLSCTSEVFGQAEKRGVERSINKSEMPAIALETLDEFWPNMDNIRYFYETDGDSETFEAKLEWMGKKYSIEFTEEGNIIDVEQLVDMSEIATDPAESINEYLLQEFDRVRITRLQRQYLADDEDETDDIDFIDDILEEDHEDYVIRYELEVEGKGESGIGGFEFLFDGNGNIIQRRRIIRRSLDNIW
jgi:hypothetical protein